MANPKTPLEQLCAGVLPHIERRIKQAYWIGANDGAQAMRERDKAELFRQPKDRRKAG